MKKSNKRVKQGFALLIKRGKEWNQHPFLFDSRDQVHMHLERHKGLVNYRIVGVRVDATPLDRGAVKDGLSAVQ